MQKVGIVTFTTGDNFGQRLQNYALQSILTDGGNEVYTIRKFDFRLSNQYRIIQVLKSVFDSNVKAMRKRHERFIEFDDQNIRYYEKFINSSRVPLNLKEKFDVFVAGSDQVWSPYSGDVDAFNFLSFATLEQKYSYAASFSVDELPVEKYGQFKNWLSGYASLCVREDKGAEIIEDLLGIKSEVVLDPTLLLDKNKWIELEKKPDWYNGEKFILKYFLGEKMIQDIETYALSNNFSIIDLLDSSSNTYVAGPAEFLFLIHNAECVITDSYHGIIFSIIFGIRFAHCKRIDELCNMQSRFETLFSKLGISESDISFDSMRTGIILDYELIHKKIQAEQEISYNCIARISNAKSNNK